MLRIIREGEAASLVQKLRTLAYNGGEIYARRGTDIVHTAKAPKRRHESDRWNGSRKSPLTYASPAELSADIQLHMMGEPVLAGPSRWTGRGRSTVKQQREATSTIVLSDLENEARSDAIRAGHVTRQGGRNISRQAAGYLPAGRRAATSRPGPKLVADCVQTERERWHSPTCLP